MEMVACVMFPRLGILNANQLLRLVAGFPAENDVAVVEPMTEVLVFEQEMVTGLLTTNAPKQEPCPVAVIVTESPIDNELSANTITLTPNSFQLALIIMASRFSFYKAAGRLFAGHAALAPQM